MTPLSLTHFTATSAIGRGLEATLTSLREERGALSLCAFETATLPTCIGAVADLDSVQLPRSLARYDSRNHRLTALALETDGFASAVRQAASRYGAMRIGVLLGTSTSGMLETELAYRRRTADGALPSTFEYGATHNSYALAEFVRRVLGLQGPATVISTACSSSAKVFGAAARMIEAGLIDAALVGGVDSLCLTTLYGFHALQLTSPQPCRPFDPARDGISIGEAAAFALLEPLGPETPPASVMLTGVGESSDAYHMSSPHPDGLGAQVAMRQALAAAGLEPHQIEYINLHGTGTPSNDSAEARAVSAVFEHPVPSSSTKGATGHTLGAAGALEAVICALALRSGLMPAGLNSRGADPTLGLEYLTRNRHAPLTRVLSNSFGFGGSNCSLVLERPAGARP
ncbi:MAG: beta-ketoacyl-[acyl-carrier-protein] synthase family protein [Steroidobacteraceae bacterium]